MTAEPSGLPEMTSRDKLGAELETLQIDVTHHLTVHHFRLLIELGATDATHLRGMVPGQTVLAAGVRSWRGLRGPRVPVYQPRKASSRCAYEGDRPVRTGLVLEDIRVQPMKRAGGGWSYTIVWPDCSVDPEADGYLRTHEGPWRPRGSRPRPTAAGPCWGT
ncbi:hypothetical protein [Streptomyces avermitilis]|uniref:hypothetical protein n=1 Tax=Streptomyces avermitilis TaxID=33903 RepID=UPI003F541833